MNKKTIETKETFDLSWISFNPSSTDISFSAYNKKIEDLSSQNLNDTEQKEVKIAMQEQIGKIKEYMIGNKMSDFNSLNDRGIQLLCILHALYAFCGETANQELQDMEKKLLGECLEVAKTTTFSEPEYVKYIFPLLAVTKENDEEIVERSPSPELLYLFGTSEETASERNSLTQEVSNLHEQFKQYRTNYNDSFLTGDEITLDYEEYIPYLSLAKKFKECEGSTQTLEQKIKLSIAKAFDDLGTSPSLLIESNKLCQDLRYKIGTIWDEYTMGSLEDFLEECLNKIDYQKYGENINEVLPGFQTGYEKETELENNMEETELEEEKLKLISRLETVLNKVNVLQKDENVLSVSREGVDVFIKGCDKSGKEWKLKVEKKWKSLFISLPTNEDAFIKFTFGFGTQSLDEVSSPEDLYKDDQMTYALQILMVKLIDNGIDGLAKEMEEKRNKQEVGRENLKSFELPSDQKISHYTLLPATKKDLQTGAFLATSAYASSVLETKYPNLTSQGPTLVENLSSDLEEIIKQEIANGVNYISLDVISHGTIRGLKFNGQLVTNDEFIKTLQKYPECTFVVNTPACFGGGLVSTCEELHASNVNVATQAGEEVPNEAVSIKDPNSTDLNDEGQLSATYYYFHFIQNLQESMKYGEAIDAADKQCYDKKDGNPRSWIDGESFSMHTDDSSEEGEVYV